jgi:hypothetical protein
MSINAVENSTVAFVVLQYVLFTVNDWYLLFLSRPCGFTLYLYFFTSILLWQQLLSTDDSSRSTG